VTDRDGTDGRHREEAERVVVRDRRRIDPKTGQVRAPEGEQPSGPGPAGAGTGTGKEAGDSAVDAEFTDVATDPAEQKLAEISAQLDERTADLQRVNAEYANYRRRVDRDREVVAVNTKATIAAQLLTVLDDIDRAGAHGDLTGPFKSVADKLVNALKTVGLESFGLVGEPFDPAVHEAVAHETSPDVPGPTLGVVMRQGYKIGDRVLRPAMVSVTDRDPGAPDLSSAPEGDDTPDASSPQD
jgi:molecular chaperone GrpE